MNRDYFKYHNLEYDVTNCQCPREYTSKGINRICASSATHILYEDFFTYSCDYQLAGRKLTKRILGRESIEELDQMIFPTLFLLRHSIELILKAILFYLFKDELAQLRQMVAEKKHTCASLFKIIRSNASIPKKEEQWLMDYLDSIDENDKNSDLFRYPIKYITNGTLKLAFPKMYVIDLKSTARKCEHAYGMIAKLYKCLVNRERHLSRVPGSVPTFFEYGGNYYESSYIGHLYDKRIFHSISKGYFESANYLSSIVNHTSGRYKADLQSGLFPPIFWLYRNAIELYLQSVILHFVDRNLNERTKILLSTKHKIAKMYDYCEKMCFPYYEIDKSDIFVISIKEKVKCISERWGDSSMFRYPVNKNFDYFYNAKTLLDYKEVEYFLHSVCYALVRLHDEIQARDEAQSIL